jgi:hypothetical protein
LNDLDPDALDALSVVSELFEVAYPNREKIQSQLRPCSGRVRLADNQTTVGVHERFRTLVSFTIRGTGEVVSGVVDFWVLDMPGPGSISAIIGLPDIVRTYLRVFQHMLEDAAEMAQEGLFLGHLEDLATEIHLLRSMSLDELKESYPDVQSSWSRPMDEIAPEELETEEPCSFTGPLYYLSKPYDEIREEYFGMFDKHIAPEWRFHPRLLELLNSEKARLVFTPEDWHGINGIELDFDFDENMPKVHRERARPINPKLRAPLEAEFKRMSTYMYVVSDSPIACPLVVAPKATFPFIRICGDYVWVNKWIKVGQYYIPLVMKEMEKAAGAKYYLDIDLTNAFHQVPLAEHTSNMLSVMTPWGLKRPKFMPEGIAPASGILQRTVMSLFFLISKIGS